MSFSINNILRNKTGGSLNQASQPLLQNFTDSILSKPIRYVLVVFMIGLIVLALIYALNLFLTLEERTNPTHDYARFDTRAIAAR